MALSPAQLAILKTDMFAEPSLASARAAGATGEIHAYYSAPSAAYVVWEPRTPANNVYDKIVWANLTPVDAPDGTATYTNRALLCQSKQINLQVILQGKETIDATKSSVRAGLQDALTNLPSGVAGANQGAGWTNGNLTMQRLATNFEKLFATGTGTTASPAIMLKDTYLTWDDITQAFYLV
jgi:hypothetical protein